MAIPCLRTSTVELVSPIRLRKVPRDITSGADRASRSATASGNLARASASRQSDATIEKPIPGISITPLAAARSL